MRSQVKLVRGEKEKRRGKAIRKMTAVEKELTSYLHWFII